MGGRGGSRQRETELWMDRVKTAASMVREGGRGMLEGGGSVGGGRGEVHISTRGLGWGGRHWRRDWRSAPAPLSPACLIHDLRIS
jgi:hypothetical protein